MKQDEMLAELLSLAKEGLYDPHCPTFRISQLIYRLHDHMKNGGKLPTGWDKSPQHSEPQKEKNDKFVVSSKMKVLDLDGNKVKINKPIYGTILKDEYGTKMVRTEDQKVLIVQE